MQGDAASGDLVQKTFRKILAFGFDVFSFNISAYVTVLWVVTVAIQKNTAKATCALTAATHEVTNSSNVKNNTQVFYSGSTSLARRIH